MTTQTSSTSPATADPRPILTRAIAMSEVVIAAVQPGQLTDPTPCAEMDVRTLLTHLVGVLDRVAALGNGEDPFAVVEAPVQDSQWVDTWNTSGQRAIAAWHDDDTLRRSVVLPWIEGSGAEVLPTYFSELTVHTWDLATATGQEPAWDNVVVEAALASRPILPAENRLAVFQEISAAMGLDEVAVPFAEVVAVPDTAAAIDRLVAWNGRNPQT